MILVIFHWFILTIFVTVTGNLFFTVVQKKNSSLLNIFLVGFFIISLIISFISINYPFLFLIFSLLIILNTPFVQNRNFFRKSATAIINNKFITIFLFCFTILLASFAADWVRDYDSYLYHLQSIKWFETNPITFGIVNLHQRLAFHTVWFNWQAVFGFSPIFGFPLPFLNSWSILLLFSFLSTRKVGKNKIIQYSSSFLLPILIIIVGSDGPLHMILRGYNPDIPAMVVTILYFVLLSENKKTKEWFISLVLISSIALLIKLSTFPLFFFTVLILLQNKYELNKTKKLKSFLFWILILSCVAFTTQNIIKSGYLVYPVAFTKVPVFWSEKYADAQNMQEVISVWAKTRSIDLQYKNVFNFNWLPKWIEIRTASEIILLITSVLGIFLTLLFGLFSKNNKQYLQIALFLFISFSYWFLIAPDFRFGFGIFFSILFIIIKIICTSKVGWLIQLSFLSLFFILFLVVNPQTKNYIHWIKLVPFFGPSQLEYFPTKKVLINESIYYLPEEGEERTNYTDFPSSPKINTCLRKGENTYFPLFYINCN